MDLELIVKINNQIVSDYNDVVVITDGFPNITWSFDPIDNLSIDEYTGKLTEGSTVGQDKFDIRISSSTLNIGTEDFIGSQIQTGMIYSKDKFWNYVGHDLSRGHVYYGQILVVDEFGRTSSWQTFSMRYNSLPQISDIIIAPDIPTSNDNLQLSYTFFDGDWDIESNTVIRWFKNGIYQKQLNNALLIESEFLKVGDLWIADILPSDGYEYGVRESSPLIKIIQTPVSVEEARILPEVPHENDILKADYIFSDSLEEDKIEIRWFINGSIAGIFNDQKYIRPDVIPGDNVRYEIKAFDGSVYVSSPEVTIGYSDFIIYDVLIDSQKEPLKASTVSPTISWKVHVPSGKEVNYMSIKIGTFYEADNVYSSITETSNNTFTVPADVLNRGQDYYISIAASDTNSFDNYASSHFRVSGSRWYSSADNDRGWTIETLFKIDSPGNFNELLYQVIRIHDGTRFGEVRIYNQKIGFVSQDFNLSGVIDTTGFNILTIVGRGNDVNIYLNRELVLDMGGKFLQDTNERFLEIGNNTNESFAISYKYFNYSTSGAYHPGVNSEYSDIQFHEFLHFEDNEVVALKGYVKTYSSGAIEDQKVFGVNPDKQNESGSIYALVSGERYKDSTVNRSFSPVNNIKISPDGRKKAFAHSRGVSVITGYVINTFDHEIDFTNIGTTSVSGVEGGDVVYSYPDIAGNGWELMKNVNYDPISFDDLGLNINTLNNS